VLFSGTVSARILQVREDGGLWAGTTNYFLAIAYSCRIFFHPLAVLGYGSKGPAMFLRPMWVETHKDLPILMGLKPCPSRTAFVTMCGWTLE